MSTWERVNCASLAGILVTLLLFGWHQPQPATDSPATAAPAAVQQAASEPVEGISVDSEPEASGIAGMTVGELMRDAWTSYHAAGSETATVTANGQFTIAPEYAASHEGSAPEYPATHFTIESTEHPGVFHVFSMVAALRA